MTSFLKAGAALVSGESVRIFNGSTLLGTATVNNTALTWTYTPTLPATAGITYSITARVADAAGNLGPASAAVRSVIDQVKTNRDSVVQPTALSLVSVDNGLGSAWWNQSVDLSRDWSTSFNINASGGSGTSDGFTFTINGDSRGLDAIGDGGQNLGFFGNDSKVGIRNSYAVIFDMWTTGPASLLGFSASKTDGDIQGNLAVPLSLSNNSYEVGISYSASAKDLVVSVGGQSFRQGIDLVALIGGKAFLGFTGANGGGTMDMNVSGWNVAVPAVRTFVLDTTAPVTTAAITDISDNVGIISGSVAAGGRTNDPTPTITGTLSAALVSGESVRIFNGATLLGTAAVNNTALTWTYTPTLPATAGITYSITARVADAAGNLGTASAARTFVLDTSAPSVASFSPLDGAIGVDTAANILVNFSEAIQRGTGAIELRVGSPTGNLIESFDAATSSRLSISGGRLTLNPTSNLAPNTRYFVSIQAGALIDAAGNPFPGTTTYDFLTVNAVTGTASNDILSFTSTVDRLTGLGGADTLRLTSLNQSLLPLVASTPFDRITDLVIGLDAVDAPVARSLGLAMNPALLGSVSELSAATIATVLTPALFPAFTATSDGGVAGFTYTDPLAGTRTFLAINDGEPGYSAATDAILEVTGLSGNLAQLQVF